MKYILQYVYYNLLAHILFLTSSYVLVSVLYTQLLFFLQIQPLSRLPRGSNEGWIHQGAVGGSQAHVRPHLGNRAGSK